MQIILQIILKWCKSFFAIIVVCAFDAPVQKRDPFNDVCPCPAPFAKAPGVPFKCFFVEASSLSAMGAKNYCEQRLLLYV